MDTELLRKKTAEAEEIIYAYLPVAGKYDERIVSAVNYSVKAGGKRLRPLLMQEFFRLAAGENGASAEARELLGRFMAAIEFIHTYSLVHDDLPAMDNDDLRRGKPTTHKAFGEAFGVLAGDALLNLAFETILEGLKGVNDAALLKNAVTAAAILAQKAGIRGMIGGQCLDVYTEKTDGAENDLEEIMYIYENKTAALLEAACMCGAALSGADESQLKAVCEYASHLGMAFQIRDDILDIISTDEVLGKPVGSDEKNSKQTYAVLKGLEESQEEVKVRSRKALECLKGLWKDTAFLEELTGYLAGREK